MISHEPEIAVGIIDHGEKITGTFNEEFIVGGQSIRGSFSVGIDCGHITVSDSNGHEVLRGSEIVCGGQGTSTFTLNDVTIGIGFHWERQERETFQGNLVLKLCSDGTIAAINVIPVEQYLTSVISSEMSAEAPLELLRAHAITSRSWLVAMLEREQRNIGVPSQRTIQREGELIRWYDREDHEYYDVCADDHCQRYQGTTKVISPAAAQAVAATRGVFLLHDNKICDARFSKSCGGLTELFENCWEDVPVPYLQCIADSIQTYGPLVNEKQADQWIRSLPDAYCNTTDGDVLRQILPSFDQETADFFRWKVEYQREELEKLLRSKSGIDFGMLINVFPIQRGPSGRIVRLRIEGTKRTLTVGKELEIRRWLSESHLYSSAFVVDVQRNTNGVPMNFVLRGAGWGHGVGLCQIGAAVMATKGFTAEEIVLHYFPGIEIRKLYA